MGGRKGYNPKNKGQQSDPPMLTFIAETREYVWGELRHGDRPSGKQIRDHPRNVQKAWPAGVKQSYGRADSGFYCRGAVEAYEESDTRFVICARKTSGLVAELRQAQWKSSPKTDAHAECEFRYQPDGWSKPYRFVALRREKLRIPMMSISHSDLMPIRAERSDAGLSQCETVIDIRQEFWRFSLPCGAGKAARFRCCVLGR
jgi:hypothetical protein